MPNRAFIFDMDGVLINSESAWIPFQDKFSTALFGPEIYKKIGSTVGLSIDTIYEIAQKHGFNLPKADYYKIYDEQAGIIYSKAAPMMNVEVLLDFLKKNGFKIGLVSSSRQVWIDIVLDKLNIAAFFDVIISLNNHPDLKPKPHSDGYRFAMSKMNVQAHKTIILEDSNVGIQSALDSGAHTIAYKEFLVPGYKQSVAHSQASNVQDVITIINQL